MFAVSFSRCVTNGNDGDPRMYKAVIIDQRPDPIIKLRGVCIEKQYEA
jgi:hypothetical protein